MTYVAYEYCGSCKKLTKLCKCNNKIAVSIVLPKQVDPPQICPKEKHEELEWKREREEKSIAAESFTHSVGELGHIRIGKVND